MNKCYFLGLSASNVFFISLILLVFILLITKKFTTSWKKYRIISEYINIILVLSGSLIIIDVLCTQEERLFYWLGYLIFFPVITGLIHLIYSLRNFKAKIILESLLTEAASFGSIVISYLAFGFYSVYVEQTLELYGIGRIIESIVISVFLVLLLISIAHRFKLSRIKKFIKNIFIKYDVLYTLFFLILILGFSYLTHLTINYFLYTRFANYETTNINKFSRKDILYNGATIKFLVPSFWYPNNISRESKQYFEPLNKEEKETSKPQSSFAINCQQYEGTLEDISQTNKQNNYRLLQNEFSEQEIVINNKKALAFNIKKQIGSFSLLEKHVFFNINQESTCTIWFQNGNSDPKTEEIYNKIIDSIEY